MVEEPRVPSPPEEQPSERRTTIADETGIECAAKRGIELAANTRTDPTAKSGTEVLAESEVGNKIEGEADFVCGCEGWMRSACAGEPFYAEHEGKRYCVLHYPGKEKSAAFQHALRKKIDDKDFDFRGVWFPDRVDFRRFTFVSAAHFGHATFSAEADFSGATFRAAADFSSAKFDGVANFGSAKFKEFVNFDSATFNADGIFNSMKIGPDANAKFEHASFRARGGFTSATFSGDVYFGSARFEGDADFNSVTFGSNLYCGLAKFGAMADFSSASFGADAVFNHSVFSAIADFRRATFDKGGLFSGSVFAASVDFAGSAGKRALGKEPSLDFQHASIGKPERVSFHTLTLRPHWFVNVDVRKFNFIDVDWTLNVRRSEEVRNLGAKGISSPHQLLSIASRQLAVNAEENHRYEEASRFRYWAMELAGVTRWQGWRLWKTDWLYNVYWVVSGYGERIPRALGWLAAVWFIFGLLYTQVGFT